MNPCNRCHQVGELTDCLDCPRTFCADCDADDLNRCEDQLGAVCAGCREDHLEECGACREWLAEDMRVQEETDRRRGK